MNCQPHCSMKNPNILHSCNYTVYLKSIVNTVKFISVFFCVYKTFPKSSEISSMFYSQKYRRFQFDAFCSSNQQTKRYIFAHWINEAFILAIRGGRMSYGYSVFTTTRPIQKGQQFHMFLFNFLMDMDTKANRQRVSWGNKQFICNCIRFEGKICFTNTTKTAY